MDLLNKLTRDVPAWVLIGACLLLVVFVAGLDYATGPELSFSIFYVIPVAIAAWHATPQRGYALAIGSALAWLLVDLRSGFDYTLAVTPYWNASVRLAFFGTVSHLLTTHYRDLERERTVAGADALTGLRNLKGFLKRVDVVWKLAERYGHTVSVAYIDLDNFKYVNDAYGHAEGDAVLKAVAVALAGSLRSTDIIARLGGDEFAVVLPETDRAGAEQVFGKVRASIIAAMQERGWPVTASVGIVMFAPPLPTIEDALRRADKVMYQTKQSGKNRVLVA